MSNMAIVDVEIPSGYVFTGHDDVSGVIERREARGSNVVFYINDVRKYGGTPLIRTLLGRNCPN